MKTKLFRITAFILAVTAVFSLAACSGTDTQESTEEPTTEPPTVAKTDKPYTIGEVLGYFNDKVLSPVKERLPGFTRTVSWDVSGFECVNEYLKASVPTLKNLMLEKKKDSFSVKDAEIINNFPVKGESWCSRLAYDDVELARCDEDATSYTVVITFKSERDPDFKTSTLAKAFDLESKASVLEEFQKAADYIIIGDYEANFTGCRISCVVNKELDEIVSVTYLLGADISAQATGVGELDGLDETVSFRYTKTTVYDSFDWNIEQTTAAPLE